MPSVSRHLDKTHFIASATMPGDARVQKGTLWSKTSSNELYICTAITPSIAFALLTGGSGAPTGSSYVVISADGTLTDERVLTAGANISITDNGPGGTVVIAASLAGGGGDNEIMEWLGL